VFEAVVRWLRANSHEPSDAKALLAAVRYPLLPLAFVNERVRKEPLLSVAEQDLLTDSLLQHVHVAPARARSASRLTVTGYSSENGDWTAECLVDGDPTTFWSTMGDIGTHWVTLSSAPACLSEVYLCFAWEGNYTPAEIDVSVRHSARASAWTHIQHCLIERSDCSTWFKVLGGPRERPQALANVNELCLAIKRNHHDGVDSIVPAVHMGPLSIAPFDAKSLREDLRHNL